MMLAKRVVVTMLCRGRTLVKGKAFAGDRSIGHVMQAAFVHARRAVDELLILDIAATAEGRGPDLAMVEAISDGCFIPITVGGGVRSIADIDALLRAGADKVAICTGLVEVPGLLMEATQRFGSQAIVACVEFRTTPSGDAHMTYRNGERTIMGRYAGQAPDEPKREWDVAEFAEKIASEGAGEILLQSVDRDGTLEGYDLDQIHTVSAAVSIPVIASGGAGSYEHMLEALNAGADAVAAGAMFAFTDATPRGAAQYLKEHGKCVRL